MPDINKMVEKAVIDAFSDLQNCLVFQSRFHTADFVNAALLWKQLPEASVVRTREKWAAVGRVPMKKAKGLTVVTRNPAQHGEWVPQEERFDISQTDGWDVRRPESPRITAEEIVRAIPEVFAVKVEFCKGVRGEFYDPDEDVVWVGQTTPRETALAAVTAVAMRILYPKHVEGEMTPKEVFFAADCAAFVVCRHFDIRVDLRRNILATVNPEALTKLGSQVQTTAREIIDRLTGYCKSAAEGTCGGREVQAKCAGL